MALHSLFSRPLPPSFLRFLCFLFHFGHCPSPLLLLIFRRCCCIFVSFTYIRVALHHPRFFLECTCLAGICRLFITNCSFVFGLCYAYVIFWPYFMVLHIHQSDCVSALVHHNVKYFTLYLFLLFVLFSFYVSPLQFTKLRIQTILRICQKSDQ